MAKNQKMVKSITSRDDDFAKWYTDIVKKAELIDYSSVRGCMILRPYGYAIWENIQKIMDKMFKETGHENVYMPMFIPESLLQKEKDHVKGFAPEVAWVTHGGSTKLNERLCIRPTSETLFCEHYSHIVESYRDLPKLYNQWCSVVRWEKTSRPFLRSVEFLWQEGHTAHETAEGAQKEKLKMLDVYSDFIETDLAIPVIKGKKTESEKFAGAVSTYTVEAMMHDGKALQSGTSHYFGDGFAKAFDITFTGRDNKIQHVHQTSWGVSTRIIGAIIMSHSDDDGLVLPPAIAPIQAVIIPVASHKGGVTERANQLADELSAKFRTKIDLSDQSPGWKFAEYEMKGVPVRIEIGPRDIEKNQCVVVRRDTREKIFVSLDEITNKVEEILKDIRDSLYKSALENRENKTISCSDIESFTAATQGENRFIKAMWCGEQECEDKIRDMGVTPRCMPSVQEHISDTCIVCGKKSDTMVIYGKAY